MEAKQIKLLASLAKKIKSEKKDRARVIASLQSAKILTKSENFTSHFTNLKKAVSLSKLVNSPDKVKKSRSF